MWSSSLSKPLPFFGSNRKSPVAISKIIQAKDHISAEVPYLAPIMTSGDLYCLVWISVEKWWYDQQPLPKSQIFSRNDSSNFGPRFFAFSSSIYYYIMRGSKFFKFKNGIPSLVFPSFVSSS